MKISYLTHPSNFNTNNGYGYAGYNMLVSLKELGHSVPFMSDDAPVEVAFCQPDWADWSNPDAYHILYTPWESTEFPLGWVEGFNEADEVWTPSYLIADWMRDAGVTKPIRVYMHGVDPVWSPGVSDREDGKFTFLHHGSPAVRKDAQSVVDAFLDLYDGDENYRLILKSAGSTEARLKDDEGNIIADIYRHPQIKIESKMMSTEELVNLYRSVDCMVYPSWGEGFGLIPLQALAVGIPTICTAAWAPYKWYLHPNLRLGSELVDSPWPEMHKGKMFKPNRDEMRIMMQYAEQNNAELKDWHETNSQRVRDDFDWVRLTEKAFEPVVKKFI